MGLSKRKTELLQRAERDSLVLQLRIRGMDYERIAKSMRDQGYRIGKSQVCNIVNARLAELRTKESEQASEIRELELRRLDALLDALWPLAVGDEVAKIDPEMGAVAQVLKIQERRAKLLGLDAPAKQELTGKDGAPLQIQEQPPDLSRLDLAELLQMKSLMAKAAGPAPVPTVDNATANPPGD